MAKKSTKKTNASKSLSLKGLKPIHGVAAGGALVLLKGLLGISILVGVTIIIVSVLAHLMKIKKAK